MVDDGDLSEFINIQVISLPEFNYLLIVSEFSFKLNAFIFEIRNTLSMAFTIIPFSFVCHCSTLVIINTLTVALTVFPLTFIIFASTLIIRSPLALPYSISVPSLISDITVREMPCSMSMFFSKSPVTFILPTIKCA